MSDVENLNNAFSTALYKKLNKKLVPLSEKLNEIERQTQNISLTPGPRGKQGERGSKGIKGDQGVRGVQGERGLIGEQGLQGLKGDRGEQGIQGIQGIQGEKGDQGPQGVRGEQGPQGKTGDTGAQGEQGIQGLKGDRGEMGLQGLSGLQGVRGETGKDGVKGDKGDQGERGPKGDKGDVGPKGDKGDVGPKGDRGEKGEQGIKGEQGPSGEDGEVPDVEKIIEPLFDKAKDELTTIVKRNSKEINNFKTTINNQVSSYTGGGGSSKLKNLVDVDSSSAKIDGNFLKYDGSTKKWIGVDIVAGAPEQLNTLNELASALTDDTNLATGIVDLINTKAPINNPLFTGNVGIGASSSSYSLDLSESSGNNTMRLVSKSGGTAIRIGAGGGSNDVTLLRIDGASNASQGNSDSSNFGFSMRYIGSGNGNFNAFRIEADNQAATSRVTALTILQDGKVGIGTTTSSEALAVAGNISFDGDLHISSDGYISWNDGSDNVISVEERLLLQSDGNTALSWSNSGVSIANLSVTNMLNSVGDLEADGAEFGINGGNVEFGGQVVFNEAVEFQDEADFSGSSLIGLTDLNIGNGVFSVDTNVLLASGTLNKVGIGHTPTSSSAGFTVDTETIKFETSGDVGLDIHNTLFTYKIGDISEAETGTYLELDSTNGFARLHGTGLSIGKALTSGKRLDVAGDSLMNNLEVEGALTASGDCEVQSDLELTQGAGINAEGSIKAKGYSLNASTFTIVSTTSTLASSTNGLTVILQNTAPITITLPTLTAGHVTTFISETSNDVTFVGDTGVTVNSFGGANTTAGQFAQCQVIYKTTTVAFLGGNLV